MYCPLGVWVTLLCRSDALDVTLLCKSAVKVTILWGIALEVTLLCRSAEIALVYLCVLEVTLYD